jgi:hypothetical protein
MRIAFIGAGSAVFGRRLVTDLMYFPEPREGAIALMDLDERRLEVMLGLANKIKRDNDLAGLSFEPTTDRRRALSGADYVIASFEVDSQTCRRLDQEIPFRYGLRVCYSSGTQRVAQTLRQMPVTIAMCREMEELCPDALLLQFGNPVPDLIMGIAQATKVGAVGLVPLRAGHGQADRRVHRRAVRGAGLLVCGPQPPGLVLEARARRRRPLPAPAPGDGHARGVGQGQGALRAPALLRPVRHRVQPAQCRLRALLPHPPGARARARHPAVPLPRSVVQEPGDARSAPARDGGRPHSCQSGPHQ